MNRAAQQLGRLGGLAKSEAKTAAARANAKKGGWPKGKKRKKKNASLDRPAASAGTVGGVVGLLPVGLIPIPPMILQEANRRAMENGDLTFGHGCALGLALCATWGLCAVAIWIKRAIVRRFHKANTNFQAGGTL